MGKSNLATKNQTLPASTPAAKAKPEYPTEGWFHMVIADLEEYETKTKGQPAMIFKLKFTRSFRYKGQYMSYMVLDSMSNRKDGGSARQDIEERFGVDVFSEPDFFLDLEVRGHIEQRPDGNGQMRSTIVSIYPNTVKENGAVSNENDQQSRDLDEEIPFFHVP